MAQQKPTERKDRWNIGLTEQMKEDFDALKGTAERKAYLEMLLKGLLDAPRHLRSVLTGTLDPDLRGKALEDIVDYFNQKLAPKPVEKVEGEDVGRLSPHQQQAGVDPGKPARQPAEARGKARRA